MTHFNDKYEQLTTDYKELCWLVMEMRSQMGSSCAPLIDPTVPATTNLLHLQRHLYFRLVVFEFTNA